MPSAAPDTPSDSKPLVDRINAALELYTRFSGGCPQHLADAIRYGLLGPGKRLRPQLVIWAASACGGTVDAAMPAACAVEMVHAYSLIHDDLPAMDNDDLRRGRPTCHKVFGESTAILAGDSLLALAFEVLARDVRPAELVARCCSELAQAAGASELVGGQADDLAAEAASSPVTGSTAVDVQTLQAIHARKTGAMFRVSLRLGGIVAGASDRQLDALDEYGRSFGLAFQITDDLLDVAGREEIVGKRVGKDARHGKMTFPRLLGVEESRRQAESLLSRACQAVAPFGNSGTPLVEIAEFILARNR
jgi:geranylgeranyl diphosphate synthase type II